jgi:hypothetical protein
MPPARACSLALAVSLGAAPSLARAQSPTPAPAPTYAPAPTTYGPTPTATPAPPASIAAPAPTAAPATPVDVSPVPPTPAPAPITPAPAAPAPIEPAPVVAPSQPAGSSVVPVNAGRTELVPPVPRLSLTIGGLFGPHAHGEASCQTLEKAYECQHTGNFLGLGGTVELRAQLYRPLFLHVRGLLVGNMRSRGVHRGMAGAGLGLGAYSRFAFVRGEYMLLPTLGPDTYYPPFYDKPAGRDVYHLHAGMFSVGVRKYISHRSSLEAWGGLVVGPRAERTSLSADAAENRLLVSFMFSLAFTYDIILARGYDPSKYPRRQPRQWGTR